MDMRYALSCLCGGLIAWHENVTSNLALLLYRSSFAGPSDFSSPFLARANSSPPYVSIPTSPSLKTLLLEFPSSLEYVLSDFPSSLKAPLSAFPPRLDLLFSAFPPRPPQTTATGAHAYFRLKYFKTTRLRSSRGLHNIFCSDGQRYSGRRCQHPCQLHEVVARKNMNASSCTNQPAWSKRGGNAGPCCLTIPRALPCPTKYTQSASPPDVIRLVSISREPPAKGKGLVEGQERGEWRLFGGRRLVGR